MIKPGFFHQYSRALLMLCFLYVSSIVPSLTLSDDTSYAKALIKFKQSLTNATMLDDWKEPLVNRLCSNNTPLWTGCMCLNGSFIGLRLERMGLSGNIDVESISNLPLFSLSLMKNNFSGPLPSGLNKLVKLRTLYLANNDFNGEIPDDAFSGLNQIMKVVLSNNRFTGKVPMSLLGLQRLVDLEIQNNEFRGFIPDFPQANLFVNLSNNKLQGSIPPTLSHLNSSSFQGNTDLCGKPLAPCKPKKTISKLALSLLILSGIALTAFIILFVICLNRRRASPLKYEKSFNGRNKQIPKHAANKKKNINTYGKLHFVRSDDNKERFEFEDLLEASAQVLGSGSFGSSYMAMLASGQRYVVRRFRQMNSVRREEFHQHMKRLGKLSHPNLLPLVAYHYRKDEKLLITPFVENGSLASHLHGKKGSRLDWATRLRIIKGVARGLAYLYEEFPKITLPHGHLKSSNVLLNNRYEPVISDYGLIPVINKDQAHKYMVSYKSPESTNNDHLDRKTDVWSLGILILELVTGHFPANYLKQGRGPSQDLATWVLSIANREDWNSEILDRDMKLTRHGEAQMIRLLEIGIRCSEWDVEKRWDLNEAVEKIQELEEKANCGADDDYCSYASEDDFCSARTIISDAFSVVEHEA